MAHGGGDIFQILSALLVLSGLAQSTELFLMSSVGLAGYFWLLH
ncbi:hypothetical protein BJ122_11984 [Rhodopseudomonas faecalis]|uniref:Uncharacterized protein n=1 Tax=Rhodopseudomonas faecalis TaxID=99655 RepID=A0A318TCZ0_9BRAD|nr:hypothetical protein BJ122_11984 [Rhodopseudomonas faecalis]